MLHENPRSRPRFRAMLFGALLCVLILVGLVIPNIKVSWKQPESLAEKANWPGLPTPEAAQPLGEQETYARAAAKASPSVVNIDTRQLVRPTVFDDWVADGQGRVNLKQGSGVVIDAKEGYILTNEHVVGGINEENRQIVVSTIHGKRLRATVVGADRTTDIALVKLDTSTDDIVGAKIGDVNALVPGQMAVAIGNPLGFQFTVTHGVISALKRPVGEYENLIQTDCAINPGNSGGALVNLQGQVVGINTVIINGAQGLGFAIPMDTALRVAAELKQYGHIKRPWLGINVVTNSRQFADNYGLPTVQGAVVVKLYAKGPALQAGIRTGDIILKANKRDITKLEDFKAFEKGLKIGQSVEIEIQRGDQRGKGVVVAVEAP